MNALVCAHVIDGARSYTIFSHVYPRLGDIIRCTYNLDAAQPEPMDRDMLKERISLQGAQAGW